MFNHSPRYIGAIVGAALLVPAGAAFASAHNNEPHQWGPPLGQICRDVDTDKAAALGYNVIVLTDLDDTFTGTPQADAIFAKDGDDKIDGLRGNDLICLGKGDDQGRGGRGSDAVFGEDDDDRIQGNPDPDYLNGGPGADNCSGGGGLDAQNGCEVWVQ